MEHLGIKVSFRANTFYANFFSFPDLAMRANSSTSLERGSEYFVITLAGNNQEEIFIIIIIKF